MRRSLAMLLILLGFGAADAEEEARARPEPGRHLDLVLDRTEHDFGVAGQHQTLEATFVLRNGSDRTIGSIHTGADCGCNLMRLSRTTLEPGQTSDLTVGFETGLLSGQLNKRVRLWTDDRRVRGEIVVVLRIAIVAGLIVEPGAVSYSDVSFGSKPTTHFHVRWYDGVGRPFDLTSVEVPGDDFQVEVGAYKPTPNDPWRGFRVDLTFKEPPPLGMYSAEVLVRTTHPDHARLSLPLSANVVGKVWVQSRTLHFGVVAQGTTRRAAIKFRPQDESVVFGEVAARSSSGRLGVEVSPDPLHADQGYWVLSVTVPADAEPGSLDDEVVELTTGVPGEEQIDLQVRGRVRGRS